MVAVLRFVLIGILLGFMIPAGAQSLDDSYRFDQIGVREGLSHSNVFGVVQDSKGFLWFTTQSGLNRFDGYQIKVFENISGDPHSLPTNSVGRMLVDDLGYLWVGTWGEGLSRYDSATGRFITYSFDQSNPRSFSGTRVLGTFKHADGSLWFGTYNNGLNLYDPETDSFERIRHRPGENLGIPHDRVWAIQAAEQHRLWLGTEEGLCKLDIRTLQYEMFALPSMPYTDQKTVPVKAIDVAHDGRVWIGTFIGLFSFPADDPAAIQFHKFDDFTTPDQTADVRCVKVDSRGGVWVGTMGFGLFHLPPGEEHWIQLQQKSNERDSLPNNFVEAIHEDRSQVLWVATFAGVAKYDLKQPKFERFIHKPGVESSLIRNEISSVFQDERGRLWLGTFGGGLSLVLDETNFTTKAYTPKTNPGMQDDVVRGIEDAEDGKIWVGTYRGGLHKFDPEQETFTVFQYDRTHPNSISSNQVRTLYRDDQGILWAGTLKGLNRFDGQNFVNGFNNAFYGRHLLNVIVNVITEDDQGDLWIGTESGLIHFKEQAREVKFYYHSESDPTGLSHDNIQDLLFDSKGRLWVGTYSGLNLFDAKTRTFKRLQMKDGLPGNMVINIMEDERGMIWLGTNSGLGRLNPETGDVRKYDIYDGLLDNGFNRSTDCVTRSGAMLIGGTKGLNRFDPDRISDNKYVPNVAITGMSRLNEPMRFEKPLYEMDQVILNYSDKVFAIEYAALDFTLPEKNQYLYKLEGFDDDWVRAGTKRHVTYTNLDSGYYTFKVKGSNNDGVWNPIPALLHIRVTPPLWATWWALTIYGVLAAIILFGLPTLRIRQLNNRRRELSLLVKQRTVELDNKARRLGELNQALLHLDETVKMINHEVNSDRLWQQLLNQGMSLVPNAEKGLILFQNRTSGQYEVISAIGHDLEQMTKVRFARQQLQQTLFGSNQQPEDDVILLQQPQPFQIGDWPKASSLLVMSLQLEPQFAGFVLFENYSEEAAFGEADRQKILRFREHALTAVSKAKLIEEVTDTADHLKSTQRLLLETAHQAGMAEIASSVLHNVGNTLNSINTSVEMLQRQRESSSWRFYQKLRERIQPQEHQLTTFFAQDPFGQKVPEALWHLSQSFAEDMDHMFQEVDQLREHLESLRVEIQSQQAIARAENLTVEFNLPHLLEEVLQIQAPLLQTQKVTVSKSLTPLPLIRGQASKLKNVLIHLIGNAVDAMSNKVVRKLSIETSVHDGKVKLCLTDTGTGIDTEDLQQVFRQGYTTGEGAGSTFGLHYCAIALREMAGNIEVDSEGLGSGCTFTLTLNPATNHGEQSRSA